MGRQCTVCEHPKRKAIEAALADPSASNRRIATQYGLSEAGVRRHKNDHMPILLAQVSGQKPTQSTQASDAAQVQVTQPAEAAAVPTAPRLRGLHTRQDVSHADRIVAQLEDLQVRALAALTKAELGEVTEEGAARFDFKAMASLIGQARGNLELQAKLFGMLQPTAVQVNILQAPMVQEFIGAAVAFMVALCPGETDTIDAWLAAARDDVDGARNDPSGWLIRHRRTVTVPAEEA